MNSSENATSDDLRAELQRRARLRRIKESLKTGALIVFGAIIIGLAISTFFIARTTQQTSEVARQKAVAVAAIAEKLTNAQSQARSQAQTTAYLKLSCLRNAQQAYDTALSVTPVPPSLLAKLQQDCGP